MSGQETAPLTPVLRLRGLSKRFGEVVANDRVNLDIRAGEVHAIVGENGAGKTTLMKIVFGLVGADAGRIEWRGQPVGIRSAAEAMRLGIGMVHQHFMLVPSFTVAENVCLGDEPGPRGLYDAAEARARTRALITRLGVSLDPDARTGALTVALQQKVEILKALYRGADLLILDEPTAVLTPQETEELFATLRELAAGGRSVIFISHKLREVLRVADQITVMRKGRAVATLPAAKADSRRLAVLMTGREDLLFGRVERAPALRPEPVLRVRGVAAAARGPEQGLEAVDLDVRPGEIVGVAGVEGNGQTALAEIVVGLARPSAGTVELLGTDVTALPVRRRRRRGLAFVPEDRHVQGLALAATVAEALIPPRVLQWSAARQWGQALPAAVKRWCAELVRDFDIAAAGLSMRCSSLSGGNQQKVILARELSQKPRVLVLAQPTRGIDVGAIDFVYRRIAAETERGCGVLLISADLDELFRLADRIIVLYRGRTVFECGIQDASREEIGYHMLGAA